MGLLSMRGVTREIELVGEIGEPACGPDGIERLDLRLRGDVNRGDFGLTWNQALETGGALLANRVRVELEISLVRDETLRGYAETLK
jgi:polyisoprenoid-binding protein YceI